MASNRIARINDELQKELSALVRRLKDPRVQDVVLSITHVEVTSDLRYAKVFVSVLPDEKARDALKGLQSAGGYLRRELAHSMQLRCTPELVWCADDSIAYGAKMLKLIDSLGVSHEDSDA